MPDGFSMVFGGYDRVAVDKFFARVNGTLGHGPLLGPPVDAAQLRDVRFRTALRGYRHADVDRALDEARVALEGRPEATPRDPVPPEAAGAVAGADAELARRVREVAFSITRLDPGYDEQSVDNFLDRAEAALRGQALPLTPEEIRAVSFDTTILRPGYNQEEVDAFLEELERHAGRPRD